MKEVIIHNRARCVPCNEVIESTHVHDYVSCRGGHIAVDGGHDYLRRAFDKRENLIECSEVEYHALDKRLSLLLLKHIAGITYLEDEVPEIIKRALSHDAVFYVRKALDEIPEIHALDYEVRRKIEKVIQMVFTGENR